MDSLNFAVFYFGFVFMMKPDFPKWFILNIYFEIIYVLKLPIYDRLFGSFSYEASRGFCKGFMICIWIDSIANFTFFEVVFAKKTNFLRWFILTYISE